MGNCYTINESSYSIAAYGLLFYLIIWWTILVADYAKGSYGLVAFTLLFPLVVLAFLVDLVLVLLLIKLRQFCFLCFATYVINLSLLVIFLFWLQWLVKRDEISSGSLNALLRSQSQSPERKAASSFYVLFIAFLGFAVLSTTYILKIRTASTRISQAKIESMLQQFYAQKVEPIDLPATNLIIGSIPEGPC